MRCIFCKQDSSSSRSVEHIIPESLGNTDYILPIGIVCDPCNNYIAREVEKPILDSLYFRERRFHARLPSKKKHIPVLDGLHLQSLTHIQLFNSVNDLETGIGAAPDADSDQWVQSVLKYGKGTLIFPISTKPDSYLVSRFIAKIGVEALAQRLLKVPGGIDEIIDNPQFDQIRQYVRLGNLKETWHHSFRTIYPPDFAFYDDNDKQSYEVLHEYDILITERSEYYIVVAIFGDEYALNLGGPAIDGYLEWLGRNNNQSPLYTGWRK